MRRKICIVTGTRAEYGLLSFLMKEIQNDPDLDLQIIATGGHLSPAFGMTINDITDDGFTVDRKVDMRLSSDTATAITKSIGHGMIGFADALHDLRPDLIVLLGDRYELVAAAYAALVARIPIAHIHGGEITQGAFDDAIRHSLTKLAMIHFVGTEPYRKRVIQMGESPDRVYLVGGMGVDTIKKTKLIEKEALEKELHFTFRKRNLLVTFHPVTLDEQSSAEQLAELLAVLNNLNDTGLIFTMPNADTGNQEIADMINQFVQDHPGNTVQFASMGTLRYLSTLPFVDAVVGNSSSGLAEAPSFKIGTINIGDRQKGRLQASSVIDCKPDEESIGKAIQKLYTDEFQESLKDAINPYGEGNATERIIEALKTMPIDTIQKEFYEL